MTKTILVCGYGPGISNAVAERFGAEGYRARTNVVVDIS